MQLIYSGPHPEVVIDELDSEQVIVAGQPVEIPDELAARLIEQSTWAQVETPEQKAAREKRDQDDEAAAVAAQAKVDADKAAEADTTTKGNS